MPSANQISGFLNQLYLKSSRVNQRDLLHAEVDRRKMKSDLIFSWVGSKIPSDSQTTEYLNLCIYQRIFGYLNISILEYFK